MSIFNLIIEFQSRLALLLSFSMYIPSVSLLGSFEISVCHFEPKRVWRVLTETSVANVKVQVTQMRD